MDGKQIFRKRALFSSATLLAATLLAGILLAAILLAACAQTSSAHPPAEMSPLQEVQPELPNPASVNCQEQGGSLEIRSDESGGQIGICIFPDGSECEEWTLFRGECSPTPLAVYAWVGHVNSAPSGSQYDDYLSLMPVGAGEIGISGINPEVEAQTVALRDGTGNMEFPAFWGSLACDVPDYGGCQLLASAVRYGQYLVEPAAVDGWKGSVACSHFNSSPSNICGNAFVLAGDFPVWYGLWSADPGLLAQIENLQDSGQMIRVWGQLLAGVPDVNGTQIQVERIDLAE